MRRPDSNPAVPQGGAGRSGGGCYHLSFRSGSRAGGACARAAHAYITRSDEYDDPDRDTVGRTESDHMPAWAKDDPRSYWDAADLYERANGRLCVSADFALPRDLSTEEQVAVAHAFAQELTGDERLPYTLAVHAGHDADGREHNPHAHLMISERQNDGVPRDKEEWFRRANRVAPDRGGAPKSRTFHGRDWMEHARERWAQLTNAMLEAAVGPASAWTASTLLRTAADVVTPNQTVSATRRQRGSSCLAPSKCSASRETPLTR